MEPLAPFVAQDFTLKKNTPQVLEEQWVDQVLSFSTQYQSQGWNATELIGPPKVYPNYGDLQGAWAPGRFNSMEFVEVKFPRAVNITRVDIYETNIPGAVTRIQAKVNQQWEILYEGAANFSLSRARIFSPSLLRSVESDTLMITLDCTTLSSWAEIDCIKLVGYSQVKPRQRDPSPLTAGLLDLFISRHLFSDVVFVVEGREIKAHRSILWARSDFFKTLFSSDMLEAKSGVVNITDFSYEVFLQLLEFAYTGFVEIREQNLLGLYCAADKYNFPELKDMCVEDLGQCLSVENVGKVLGAVSQMGNVSPPLVQVCLTYIKNNLREVSRCPQFEELPKDLLLSIMRTLSEP